MVGCHSANSANLYALSLSVLDSQKLDTLVISADESINSRFCHVGASPTLIIKDEIPADLYLAKCKNCILQHLFGLVITINLDQIK